MDLGNILFTIGNLSQATSILLIFAAVLFIFLLLLIVITIKVFRSGKDDGERRASRDEDDDDDEPEEETVSIPAPRPRDPFPTYEDDTDEDEGPDFSEAGTTVLSTTEKDPDIRKIVEETQAAVNQAIESERTEARNKAEQRKAKESAKQAQPKQQDNTLDFAEVRRRLAEQEALHEEDDVPPDMSDYDISQDSAFASDGEPVFEVDNEEASEEPTTVIDSPAFRDPDLDDGFEDEDLEDEEAEDIPPRKQPPRRKPAAQAEPFQAPPEDDLLDEEHVTFGEQMSMDQYLSAQPDEEEESDEYADAYQDEELMEIDPADDEPTDPTPSGRPRPAQKESTAGSGKITVNPVNAVNIQTVNAVGRVNTINPEAGINDMHEVEDFLTENPVPKKSKKKIKKKDAKFEARFGSREGEIEGAKYFWYNSQDIEGLSRKEDMYFYCHYFEQPEKAVMALVTEMYDCGFVRTEEIQKIAFGVQFKSIGMKEILSARDNISFDKAKVVKTPDEKDRREISKKWCEYVDQFLGIIVFNAPVNVQTVIRDRLYAYGNHDPEVLIYSPQ